MTSVACAAALAVEPASTSRPPPHGSGNAIYDCPLPPGFLAEQDRRREEYYLGDRLSDRDGWYALVPVPMHVSYGTPLPVKLDTEATPYLVGPIWGGIGFGDIIDRRMVCGHSIAAHDWNVLLEAYGDGFATMDLRLAVEDQALPVEAGEHEIAPYAFDSEIDGRKYRYIVTSVSAGLTKVWRPDLVELAETLDGPSRQPDSGDPDAVWPVLDRFSGVLLTASLPQDRLRDSTAPGVRDANAIAAGIAYGTTVMFDATTREQPVDIGATPHYHGRFFGVEAAHPGEPDPDTEFTFIPEGEVLLVQRPGGPEVRVNLSAWLDRQRAEIAAGGGMTTVAITDPLLEFRYDGAVVRFVLHSVWASVDVAGGRARCVVGRIGGDLFADRPLF